MIYQRFKSDFSSFLGSLGISVDIIVNSQETKLLVFKKYKAHLQTQKAIKEMEDKNNKRLDTEALEFFEQHLGESLRQYFIFGNRYNILQWMRGNAWWIGLILLLAFSSF